MATPRGWLINRCEPLLGNVGQPPGVNAYRTLPGFHTLCLTGSQEGRLLAFLAGSQTEIPSYDIHYVSHLG